MPTERRPIRGRRARIAAGQGAVQNTLLAAVLAAAGCGGPSSPPPSSGASSPPATEASQRSTAPLRATALPDLSSASAAVQEQIRQQYSSLMSAIERAGASASDRANAYGGMGALLMAAEYLDAAEPCLLNAQTLAPDEIRWTYYLGHLYRFRNDPAHAAVWFETAARLQPAHVPALVWLGEMYLAQDQPDMADPVFRKALALDPQSAAARYGLGRIALAKQDYAAASSHLEAALAAAPAATRIHYPLAQAYRGLGERQKAEAHLARRGEANLEPPDPMLEALGGLLKNASAYEVRGAEALDKRQWPEAVTNLRKAAAIAPDNALTRLNLGTALYLTGDAKGAIEQFEAAIRLSPDLPKAHFGLGVVLEAAGRDREAIGHFSLAVKSDPAYVEARMQLADALRRTGQLPESLSHYKEIVRTAPGASQALFGEAMALVRLARYQEAKERLTDGVRIYADQPGFAHALARVLAAAPEDRVRDGRRALAILEGLWKQQQTVALAETMAMALAETGRFDEAVSWQRDAIAARQRQGPDRPADLTRMTDTLALYKRRQPCRTPWRADDPIFYPRPAS